MVSNQTAPCKPSVPGKTLLGMLGSVNSSAALLKASSAFAPSAYFRSRALRHRGSSPYLPGKMRKVSPTQASAILQSTKELNRNFSVGINTALGVGERFSASIVGEGKRKAKLQHTTSNIVDAMYKGIFFTRMLCMLNGEMLSYVLLKDTKTRTTCKYLWQKTETKLPE